MPIKLMTASLLELVYVQQPCAGGKGITKGSHEATVPVPFKSHIRQRFTTQHYVSTHDNRLFWQSPTQHLPRCCSTT